MAKTLVCLMGTTGVSPSPETVETRQVATFPLTVYTSLIHLLCHMDTKNQSSRDSCVRTRAAAMLSSQREQGGLPVILEASKERAPTLPCIDFVALLEVSAKNTPIVSELCLP